MLFLYQKLMAWFVCRKNGHFFLINDISGRDATGRVHWSCSVCGKPHVGENGKAILEASGGRCDIDPEKVNPLVIAIKGGLGEKIWCQILDLFYGSSVHLDISQMFPGDDYLSKAMREPYSEEFSEFGEADYEDVAHQVEEAVDWLRSNAMVLCACFDEKSGIESVVEQIKEVHFLDGSVQEIGDD